MSSDLGSYAEGLCDSRVHAELCLVLPCLLSTPSLSKLRSFPLAARAPCIFAALSPLCGSHSVVPVDNLTFSSALQRISLSFRVFRWCNYTTFVDTNLNKSPSGFCFIHPWHHSTLPMPFPELFGPHHVSTHTGDITR